jgi:hypothetical protein
MLVTKIKYVFQFGKEKFMAHTFQDSSRKYCIHHNGDYDGDIDIVNVETDERIEDVPMRVIKEFMRSYIEDRLIHYVEQEMDIKKIVGLDTDTLKKELEDEKRWAER